MNNHKKGFKKDIYQEERLIVDTSTGEIANKKTTTIQKSKLPREPDFIKFYLQDILYLNDLAPSQSSLLQALLKQLTYNNQIILNGAIKKQIAKEINISVGTIDNNLSKFVKGNILFRTDTGIYETNPYFFGRGSWEDIYSFRLEVNYDDIKGRTFKTNIEYEPEDDIKVDEVNAG